jgi:hypothetical protein
MEFNGSARSFARTAVLLLVIGFAAIITLKVTLAVTGIVLGLFFAAVFTVGPILLVGWLVLKGLRRFSGPPANPV